MKAKNTVLYIHPDAKQLRRGQSFLKNSGYTVLSAASGRPALRLLASHTVHAVVLDDVVIRDECAVAGSIKDALVAKADPPEFLLATLHFMLNAKREPKARARKER